MPPIAERSSVIAWRPWTPALNEPISPNALIQVVQLICSLKPPRWLPRTRFVTIAPWRSPPRVCTEPTLDSVSPIATMSTGCGPLPIWAEALLPKAHAATPRRAAAAHADKRERTGSAKVRETSRHWLPAAERGMAVRTGTDPTSPKLADDADLPASAIKQHPPGAQTITSAARRRR